MVKTGWCWVVVAAVSCVPGCVFYDLPERKARDVLLPADAVAELVKSESIWRAVRYGLVDVRKDCEAQPPGTRAFAEFLHLSDAQIHDERLFEEVPEFDELNFWDSVVDVSQRRALVERFDTLTLRAFLFGYAKAYGAHDSATAPFIVHTGDLLDISVATELAAGVDSFREAARRTKDLRVFSVTGNHDGITWGNIADIGSDTRGLGINAAEFELGHLLADDEDGRGFGFGGNELLHRFRSGHCDCVGDADTPDDLRLTAEGRDLEVRSLCSEVNDALENVQRARGRSEVVAESLPPIQYRGILHVGGLGNGLDLRLGYYAWRDDLRNRVNSTAMKGIRYIALDTRSRALQDGSMDDVQLGWLYGQLANALAMRDGVVLFSHHRPQDMNRESRQAMRAVLSRFPNVIALFYGHKHWNSTRVERLYGRIPAIQTGSLADFPQVARQVRLTEDSSSPDDPEAVTIRISSLFVRPQGCKAKDIGTANGCEKADQAGLLNMVLNASRKDSEKDYRKDIVWGARPDETLPFNLPVRRAARSVAPFLVSKFGDLEWDDFKCSNRLAPEDAVVTIRLPEGVDEVPSPVEIFGAKRLSRIRQLRTWLGLKAVPDRIAGDTMWPQDQADGSVLTPQEVERNRTQANEKKEVHARVEPRQPAVAASTRAR